MTTLAAGCSKPCFRRRNTSLEARPDFHSDLQMHGPNLDGQSMTSISFSCVCFDVLIPLNLPDFSVHSSSLLKILHLFFPVSFNCPASATSPISSVHRLRVSLFSTSLPYLSAFLVDLLPYLRLSNHWKPSCPTAHPVQPCPSPQEVCTNPRVLASTQSVLLLASVLPTPPVQINISTQGAFKIPTCSYPTQHKSALSALISQISFFGATPPPSLL